jgi:hypothetical protein
VLTGSLTYLLYAGHFLHLKLIFSLSSLLPSATSYPTASWPESVLKCINESGVSILVSLHGNHLMHKMISVKSHTSNINKTH